MVDNTVYNVNSARKGLLLFVSLLCQSMETTRFIEREGREAITQQHKRTKHTNVAYTIDKHTRLLCGEHNQVVERGGNVHHGLSENVTVFFHLP